MGENGLHVYQDHGQGASTHCVVWDTPPGAKGGIIALRNIYRESKTLIRKKLKYLCFDLNVRFCEKRNNKRFKNTPSPQKMISPLKKNIESTSTR